MNGRPDPPGGDDSAALRASGRQAAAAPDRGSGDSRRASRAPGSGSEPPGAAPGSRRQSPWRPSRKPPAPASPACPGGWSPGRAAPVRRPGAGAGQRAGGLRRPGPRRRQARADDRDGRHDTVIKPGPPCPAVPGGLAVDDCTAEEEQGAVTRPGGVTRPMSGHRAVTSGPACSGCPPRARRTTTARTANRNGPAPSLVQSRPR
jgi:hypothetical protein